MQFSAPILKAEEPVEWLTKFNEILSFRKGRADEERDLLSLQLKEVKKVEMQ